MLQVEDETLYTHKQNFPPPPLRLSFVRLMSTKHLSRVVQHHHTIHDSELVDFLVRLVLALSTRILAQGRSGTLTWPFAPFAESGIYSYTEDWNGPVSTHDDRMTRQNTSHWMLEALSELSPGVAALDAVNRQRLLVFLDFVVYKVLCAYPATYLEALHSIVIRTISFQPLGMYHLCQELGVWPTDFSSVVRNAVVSKPTIPKEQLIVTVDTLSLRVTDLARIVVDYAYDPLPGHVTYQRIHRSEHNDVYWTNSCADLQTWKVCEILIADANDRLWRLLVEECVNKNDDDDDNDDNDNKHKSYMYMLVRCAETGLPLFVHKRSLWHGLCGFVYHPIATTFAFHAHDQELPDKQCASLGNMRTRWGSNAYARMMNDSTFKRLRVLQQRIVDMLVL
jgi:hypothetical protein